MGDGNRSDRRRLTGGGGRDVAAGAALGALLGAALAAPGFAARTAPPPSADCAAIAEDARRLACYDRAYRGAASGGAGVSAAPAADAGPAVVPHADVAPPEGWRLSQGPSPIDGSPNVTLELISPPGAREGGGAAAPARLVIACRENVTNLYIVYAGAFMAGEGEWGRVVWRVDGGRARAAQMRESGDNAALGLWTGRAAIPMVRALLKGRALSLRATPFNGEAMTHVFPIAGLDAAIAPLRRACGWSSWAPIPITCGRCWRNTGWKR